MDRKARAEAYRLPPADEVELAFRHSGWWECRERVRRGMVAANLPAARRDRFDSCGGDCVCEYSPSLHRHRLRANYCGDRWCEPCRRSRAIKVRANLLDWCKGERVRFGTWGIRSKPDDRLSDLLDRLLRSFAKLRETKVWRAQRAGCYVVEVTRGEKLDRWHVHLHVLFVGSFIDQAELSAAWHRVTGDSMVVDVREVRDHERGVGYVAKYVGKGVSQEVTLDADCLIECILALRGRRMLGTFGEWRSRGLEVRGDEASDWRPIGRLSVVYAAAAAGSEWAAGVFKSLGVAAGSVQGQPTFVGVEVDWSGP